MIWLTCPVKLEPETETNKLVACENADDQFSFHWSSTLDRVGKEAKPQQAVCKTEPSAGDKQKTNFLIAYERIGLKAKKAFYSSVTRLGKLPNQS